jgi:hypothetical protein
MLPTTSSSPRHLDIASSDGRHIRRGYLEITVDETTTTELTADQRKHPAVLLTLYQRRGAHESAIDSRVFATTLQTDLTDEQLGTLAVAFMNKLTDDLNVTAFTSSLDIWHEELESFARYADVVEVAWFSPSKT